MTNETRRDRHFDTPRTQSAWGIYNYGHLVDIASRKRDAVAIVESRCGEPWAKARKYMEIRKVSVVPA